jgi:hypothetical protein
MQKKYNSLKNDYKGLLDAFEKSEKIRGEQKELILKLEERLAEKQESCQA